MLLFFQLDFWPRNVLSIVKAIKNLKMKGGLELGGILIFLVISVLTYISLQNLGYFLVPRYLQGQDSDL